MISQSLIASYNPPLRVVDGANFDGTNDFQVHAGTFAGAAISKRGIASLWFRMNGGDAATHCFFSTSTGTRLVIQRVSSNVLTISGKNGTGTQILAMNSTNTFLAGSGWKNLLAMWDLAVGASACGMWVQDVSQTLDTPVFTNDNIGYTDGGSPSIGAFSNGTSKANADFADVYIGYGQWLDFNLIHNRRKFISASGKPVHLGTDGSFPTGIAPICYVHLNDGEAVANFATNRGTGGDFTITGTLTTSSASPSD